MHTRISPLINTSRLIFICFVSEVWRSRLSVLLLLDSPSFQICMHSQSHRVPSNSQRERQRERYGVWYAPAKKNMSACTQTCTQAKNQKPTKTKQKMIVKSVYVYGRAFFVSGSSKNYKNFPISLVISIKWSNASEMCLIIQISGCTLLSQCR